MKDRLNVNSIPRSIRRSLNYPHAKHNTIAEKTSRIKL
uniref:Uncharacterized protein n=1 Tax=Myoviridae sp. ctHaT25 TaxID=2826635 RepID=A0A8S5N930_9CAUD|nr:MAG TPA: hypothetical protein [Myoviridae sp. ctHaT25]